MKLGNVREETGNDQEQSHPSQHKVSQIEKKEGIGYTRGRKKRGREEMGGWYWVAEVEKNNRRKEESKEKEKTRVGYRGAKERSVK